MMLGYYGILCKKVPLRKASELFRWAGRLRPWAPRGPNGARAHEKPYSGDQCIDKHYQHGIGHSVRQRPIADKKLDNEGKKKNEEQVTKM